MVGNTEVGLLDSGSQEHFQNRALVGSVEKAAAAQLRDCWLLHVFTILKSSHLPETPPFGTHSALSWPFPSGSRHRNREVYKNRQGNLHMFKNVEEPFQCSSWNSPESSQLPFGHCSKQHEPPRTAYIMLAKWLSE